MLNTHALRCVIASVGLRSTSKPTRFSARFGIRLPAAVTQDTGIMLLLLVGVLQEDLIEGRKALCACGKIMTGPLVCLRIWTITIDWERL